MFDTIAENRPNLNNKAVESSQHHSIMKSKSASHVEQRHLYQHEQELDTRKNPPAQNNFPPAPVRQVSPDQVSVRAGVHNLQANSSKQQLPEQQQQICDDRTPRYIYLESYGRKEHIYEHANS